MKTKIRLQISDLLNDRFKLSTVELEKKYLKLLPRFIKIEPDVLKGLKKITGLSFKRNYIDVFLINPDNLPSISHPTIVKIDKDIDKTIRTIVHEIIHSLMWDNTKEDNW